MAVTKISLKETRLGLRNSTTRLPFRYGSACLTRCPQAILQATIEHRGKRSRGYAGDCFPPGWFDKSGKSFAEQIDDMLAAIKLAELSFLAELAAERDFFAAWLAAGEAAHRAAGKQSMTPLLASFGVSMVERAVIDAACRAAGVRLFQALQENLLGIAPGEVHPELAGIEVNEWLPARPVESLHMRHTVGLSDPLTAGEIAAEDRVDDGLPQALEEYIERTGTRYFKIKVSNRLEHDIARLKDVAAIAERHLGADYRVTLDGNEQYKQAEEFDALMAAIREEQALSTLLAGTLVIEQPLERRIALDAAHTSGIRELGETLPVIVDESDGALDSYRQAIGLGYRGVSSKNCKGPLKSLLNAGLTWLHNGRSREGKYVMTGEDLCTVGVVPVQSDLALVAALGLTHVERNGHHYHPGLSYLPQAEQEAALQAHPDFYARQGPIIGPHVRNGKVDITSLQCVGYGFAVEPDLASYTSPEEWDYASLGLDA